MDLDYVYLNLKTGMYTVIFSCRPLNYFAFCSKRLSFLVFLQLRSVVG